MRLTRYLLLLLSSVRLLSASSATTTAPNVEPIIQSGHSGTINGIVALQDRGTIVSVSQDTTIRFWTLANAWEVRRLRTAQPIVTVAESPNGESLLTGGSDKAMTLWKLPDLTPEFSRPMGDFVVSAAYSSDGAFVAANSQNGVVSVWTADKGDPVCSFRNGVSSPVAFLPGKSLLVASGAHGEILRWDVGAAGCASEPTIHTGESYISRGGFAVFRERRELAVVSSRNHLSLWDMDSGCKKWLIQIDDGEIEAVAVEPDGRSLVVTTYRSIVRVERKSGTATLLYRNANETFTTATFTRDGKALLVASNVEIVLYDYGSGREVRRFGGNATPIEKVVISHDSNYLLSASGRNAELWDLRLGRRLDAFKHLAQPVSAVAFSPCQDGFAIASSDKTLTIWRRNGSSFQFTRQIDFTSWVNAVEYADCNTVVTGSGDPGGEVGASVIDATTGGVLSRFTKHLKPVHSVAVSKESGLAASADEGHRVCVWRLKGSEVVWCKDIDHLSSSALAFSSDGKMLATATFMEIDLWNTETGASLGPIPRYDGKIPAFARYHPLTSITFSPHGDLVAAGGWDGRLKVWNLSTRTMIRELESSQSRDINSITFSGAGDRIVAGTDSGAIDVWQVGNWTNLATLYSLRSGQWISLTRDGYYEASGYVGDLVFKLDGSSYPFEQFDVELNRPDIVIERLGAAPETVAAFRRAYEKRLAFLNAPSPEPSQSFHVPEIVITKQPPLFTQERFLEVPVRAMDSTLQLDHVNVIVNDVPIYGVSGIRLRDGRSRTWTGHIRIELGMGDNKIQISVVNSEFHESVRHPFRISYRGPPTTPDLYIVGIGVTEYKDTTYKLDYAAKDAADFISFWCKNKGRFGTVHALPLLDMNATKEKIVAARSFLSQAKVDDYVIVFVAGHGLLDDDDNYYFATVDVDFDDPSQRGLAYDKIEQMLDGLEARQRLVLMDTCHAGDVDRGDSVNEQTPTKSGASPDLEVTHLVNGSTGDVPVVIRKAFPIPRGARGRVGLRLGVTQSFALMQTLFVDLRTTSGSDVIGASAGEELAVNQRVGSNGLFTFAVLEGLGGKAARDKGGMITVSSLEDYVAERVSDMSDGQQHPVFRHENLAYDFPLL